MKTFDFYNNNAVGYVDILPNGNANIDILGYVDKFNVFHYLNSKEVVNLFPPKGRVFAHNFIQKNESYRKKMISLAVIPNTKDGEGLDSYIWDKSVPVYEFGTQIKTLKANINEDGENNFCIFQENDLIESETDKYILSGDKVYYIKAQSKDRLIPYWNISNLDIIDTPYGKKYIPTYQMIEKDGCIDITNDDQLINWFMTKILRKHYTEIMAGGSFEIVEQYLVAAFNDMKNLPSNVYKSRLDRIKKLSTNFIMTLDELNEISNIPWVKNVIQESVDTHKQNLISESSTQYKIQLNKIKEEYDLQIELEKERYNNEIKKQKNEYEATLSSISSDKARIVAQLEEKKFDIEILDETIASKKKEIDDIEAMLNRVNERKSNILSDFSIIKEVLGANVLTCNIDNSELSSIKSLNIECLEHAEAECFMFNAYKKSLEDTLKANKISHKNASTIADMLVVYKTMLVPDIVYAMSIIHATQRCFYAIEYVNVGWKSFDDLWKDGLFRFVQHCNEEPEVMHFLILQNINLSYIPNYMQPLVDIQIGISSNLPQGFTFPNNLRILCTLADGDVLPMSGKCLSYLGCIEKDSKEIHVSRFNTAYNPQYGFLSPSKLKEGMEGLNDVPNFYKSYTDE